MTKPLIAVIGPTASGKTRRAVAVARRLDGEIVSADSRQIYRGMDVGTGKDLDEYGEVPYHMIDIVPAGYRYNLYEYIRDASAAIADIESRGKQVVVCGGTGMYVEHLLRGISLPQVPENTELRQSLRGLTLPQLEKMLASMKRLHNSTDTDTAARAIRAIEIETYYQAHPEQARQAHQGSPRKAVTVCVDIPREQRRRLISERMRRRFDSEDMLGEVRRLIGQGVEPDSLIYYGLEYKFLTLHIQGLLSRADMEAQLEMAIHQFAKRQMTWIRGMERRGMMIHYLPYDMPDDVFVDAVIRLTDNYEG